MPITKKVRRGGVLRTLGTFALNLALRPRQTLTVYRMVRRDRINREDAELIVAVDEYLRQRQIGRRGPR